MFELAEHHEIAKVHAHACRAQLYYLKRQMMKTHESQTDERMELRDKMIIVSRQLFDYRKQIENTNSTAIGRKFGVPKSYVSNYVYRWLHDLAPAPFRRGDDV